MLRSIAKVETQHAPRYRDQLARHGAGMLRHRRATGADGPPIRDALTLGDELVLELAWGRCSVTATDTTLLLVAEASTADDLQRVQAGVGRRVAGFGRREGLSVSWSAPDDIAGGEGGTSSIGSGHTRPGLVALGAAVVGLVAVHLGLAAALLHQGWTWWLIAGVGFVVLVKAIFFRHVALARWGRHSGLRRT